ncbi:MAG: GNAT family protein [Planctomycetota bacterium]
MDPVYHRGNRLDLRPISMADAEIFVRWFNDPDVSQYLGRDVPITLEEEKKWIEGRAGDAGNQILVMVHRAERRPIGTVGLHGMAGQNRKAVFGIQIGEKEFWNQGLGREATELTLEIAFDRLNLNRVELEVYETNPRAIRVYERAGYRTEGVARQGRWIRGRYVDVRRMAILAEEWRVRKSLTAASEVCQT